MAVFIPYLQEQSAFDPEAIQAMSRALDEVCAAFRVDADDRGRTAIAARIIELAGRGEVNADRLRDRVLRESNSLSVLTNASLRRFLVLTRRPLSGF
jgi:hypothetical protein